MNRNTRYYSKIGAAVTGGNRRELTNEQLIAAAPSVGSEFASSVTSSKYSFIPTIEVVNALRDCGYTPVHVSQSGTRVEARKGFQTHEIRLRKGGLRGHSDLRVGDVVPEIVLKNSHDRGSSFITNLGLFRAVCSNGLLVSEQDIASVRCRHVGLEIQDVLDAVTNVAAHSGDALTAVEKYQTINLKPEDVIHLNRLAIESRWGSVEDLPGELTELDFLRPKRTDDRKSDLWTVLNVIQENILRGGQRYIAKRNARGFVARRGSVRAIGSIDTQRKVNQNIWEAARELAEKDILVS